MDMDYEAFVSKRIFCLRQSKGVSARDMSLSLGQNVNYINKIENRKNLPSMQVFFYICDYLGVTPMEFFDLGSREPEYLNALIGNLKRLDAKALAAVAGVVEELIR